MTSAPVGVLTAGKRLTRPGDQTGHEARGQIRVMRQDAHGVALQAAASTGNAGGFENMLAVARTAGVPHGEAGRLYQFARGIQRS